MVGHLANVHGKWPAVIFSCDLRAVFRKKMIGGGGGGANTDRMAEGHCEGGGGCGRGM